MDVSLKTKLIVIYTVLITIIVLSTGIITHNIAIDRLEESEKNYLFQNLKQTGSLIDFDFEMYLRKSEAIFANTVVQTAISKDYSNADLYEIQQTFKDKIYGIITPIMQDITHTDYTSKVSTWNKGMYATEVVIYSMNESLPVDGGIIRDFKKIEGEEWVDEVFALSGKPWWRGIFTENDTEYVSINRMLKTFDTRNKIGILSIMIPKMRISYLLSQNNKDKRMKIYLVDDYGNIITSRLESDTYHIEDSSVANYLENKKDIEEGIDYNFINNDKYIFAHYTLGITGWKLVGISPYNSVYERVQPIRYTIIFVLVTGIIFSMIITMIISHVTTRRLGRITRKMNKLKHNRHAVLEVIPGKDEIGQLDSHFNDMINTLNSLVEKERQLQMQSTSLQLELLQSQINSHILYNTLATISWRAKKANVNDVCDVAEKLIRFFKHYLNSGEIVTKFSSEIEMVRHYIDILKFTYYMDISCRMEIQSEIYDYYTLNLVLQPIVENALIHGLRPLNRPGMLEIKGEIVDNSIYLMVKDNGVGMSKEIIEKLNSEEHNDKAGSFGLINVKKRIRLYFGEEYGINIISEPGKGSEVVLHLPVLSHEEIKEKISTVI